ncbi:hypothetical protein ACFXTN_039805 [Malus domestica]
MELRGIPSLAEICLRNRFSKDNEPFKAEKLFQTQGGPIILSQKDDYNLVAPKIKHGFVYEISHFYTGEVKHHIKLSY